MSEAQGGTGKWVHECEVPDISLKELGESWTCPVCNRYWVPELEWQHHYNADGSEWQPEPPPDHIPYDR